MLGSLGDAGIAAATHAHAASDITSGTLVHERGGLEADVSAYAGLLHITGGTTSEKTIGIADDNILEVDDAGAADDQYARFTANGIEGRSITGMLNDLGLVGAIGDLVWIDAGGVLATDTLAVVGVAPSSHVGAGGGAHADVVAAGADGFMTGADKTKLNGIEALADVTDGANVATAGAVMDADFGADGLLERLGGIGVYAVTTITAAGKAILDDANAAAQRTTLGLVIGTNVLAEQTIGIADNNLVEIDHAGVVDNDYAKFTANGLEGRSYAEVYSDLSLGTIATQAANNVALTGGTIAGATIGVAAQASIKGTTIESTDNIILAFTKKFYYAGAAGGAWVAYNAGLSRIEFYVNSNLCGYIDEGTGFVDV